MWARAELSAWHKADAHGTSSLILCPLNEAKLVASLHKAAEQPQGDQRTQGSVPTRHMKVRDVQQRPGETMSRSLRLGSANLGVGAPG